MSLVNCTVSGAVATITLSRPPVNALNAELVAAIGAALDTAADPDAVRFASGPTVAFSAVKRATVGGYGSPFDRGLEIEAAEFERTFHTADARVGVAAFLAKEKPQFEGR